MRNSLGTSGEFALLTNEERTTVIDAFVDRANGGIPTAGARRLATLVGYGE